MTGAHVRIERDGKWQSIEIEYLTKEELYEFFEGKPPEEIFKWVLMLCETLKTIS